MLGKFVITLGLLLPAAGLRPAAAAEALPPASRWIRPGPVLAVEFARPGALLDLFLDEKVICLSNHSILCHPASPGIQVYRSLFHSDAKSQRSQIVGPAVYGSLNGPPRREKRLVGSFVGHGPQEPVAGERADRAARSAVAQSMSLSPDRWRDTL